MNGSWIEPQVSCELESLNNASEVINQLENEISEKRNNYRTALSESTRKLNRLSSKLGDSVAKARPYYEKKRLAKEAQAECQLAAVRYERAVSMHTAAREMVAVAEQGMIKDSNQLDTAWPEMLNHATLKVNDSEVERISSEHEHQEKAESFKVATMGVRKLEKKLKSSIAKSRPYFELKQDTQKQLESLSNEVKAVDLKLMQAKLSYSQSLKNLEEISNAIHASRGSLRLPKSPTVSRNSSYGFGSMEDCSSIQTVLSDLKKFDSVDQLDQISNSSSNETNEDHPSPAYPQPTPPPKDPLTPPAPSESNNNNRKLDPPRVLLVGDTQKVNSPLKGNSPSPKQYNGELVISVAGLAEVTTS
nr:SH3 domain-binding protein 5-like [Ciona intestinalis]|eukprot:XP_002123986.3 SH3 domain-binding protein 5-like [Ciona intestinalis]